MITRTTSSGHTLTLLEPGEVVAEQLNETRREGMLAVLSAATADVMAGKVAGLVVLGVPSCGQGMEFYSTGMALGDLLILREEFSEVIDEVRTPDTE